MKVIITAVGVVNRNVIPVWPKDWPVPRVDDEIEIPGLAEVSHIRVVEWHPMGDSEGNKDPYVYVVAGPRRKTSP